MSAKLHRCIADLDLMKHLHGMYGCAIERCQENAAGELWCDNDEYATRVNFCPFCGYEAPERMPSVNEP